MKTERCSKVLTAAGLTYVAAVVTAILWLLYYAWPLIAACSSIIEKIDPAAPDATAGPHGPRRYVSGAIMTHLLRLIVLTLIATWPLPNPLYTA